MVVVVVETVSNTTAVTESNVNTTEKIKKTTKTTIDMSTNHTKETTKVENSTTDN